MRPREFYEISPRHLSLMIQGYNDRKVEDYKMVRLLMFTMVRLHGDPKTAPKTPEALWQLPGDEELGMKEEDIRELFNRIKSK